MNKISVSVGVKSWVWTRLLVSVIFNCEQSFERERDSTAVLCLQQNLIILFLVLKDTQNTIFSAFGTKPKRPSSCFFFQNLPASEKSGREGTISLKRVRKSDNSTINTQFIAKLRPWPAILGPTTRCPRAFSWSFT